MEGTEAEPATQQQFARTNMQSEMQPPHKRFKGAKRKHLQHSADIVFTKGATIQTIASLTKHLKGVTEPVIGLQYVWEYRSPSKSVAPHYQCKLCTVSRLQHDMLAHVKGWKHSFRYLKRSHADKVTSEEEEAIKDPAVRKKIKEVAAEVEKTEGRGQLKVVLKEPCDVPAFKGLRSAIPKAPPPGGMGMKGPGYGDRYSDMMYHGEYHESHYSDYSMGDLGDHDMGGYSSGQGYSGPDMDPGPYQDGAGLSGRDSYGMSGLLGEGPGRGYTDEFRGGQGGNSLMDRPMERPGLMGAAPESSSLPSTLLSYLDTFRIENENDAQIVLKVTQKLTDVLMEYRLRSVSSGGPSVSSTLNNSSLSSLGYSSPPSRLPNTGDRYSGGNPSGPSRYSDGPSRFYN